MADLHCPPGRRSCLVCRKHRAKARALHYRRAHLAEVTLRNREKHARRRLDPAYVEAERQRQLALYPQKRRRILALRAAWQGPLTLPQMLVRGTPEQKRIAAAEMARRRLAKIGPARAREIALLGVRRAAEARRARRRPAEAA